MAFQYKVMRVEEADTFTKFGWTGRFIGLNVDGDGVSILSVYPNHSGITLGNRLPQRIVYGLTQFEPLPYVGVGIVGEGYGIRYINFPDTAFPRYISYRENVPD